MSDAVDLSSMIGTWVGAGIGIVALIGVVGPLLVFFASRTKRHQTLNAMGRDTNGYVSPGWHLGPNIYLGQRIRAPELQRRGLKTNLNGKFTLNTAMLKSFDTQAHWVHFGALLEAYNMKFTKGGDILIQDGKTYLPVHPSWILCVGLLGRFTTGRASGSGQSKRSILGGHLFKTSGSPPMLPSGASPLPPPRFASRGTRYVEESPERGDERRIRATVLNGLTGSFEITSKQHHLADGDHFPILTFHIPLTTINTIQVEDDTLPTKELFLLSIGLISIREGHYLSLEDAQPAELEENNQSSDYGDSDDVEEDNIRDRRRERTRRRPRYVSDDDDVDVRGYKLGPLDIADQLVKMGSIFTNLSIGHDCVGFTADHDRKTLEQLKDLEGNTHVAADSDWVRVGESTYILRVDAQIAALALLKLQWSSQGYLVGGSWSGVIMSAFKSASDCLHPMMIRLRDVVARLEVNEQEKKKLTAAILPLLRRLDTKHVSRDIQTFRKLHDLNTVLLQLGNPGNQDIADKIVAILSITNEEFRDIVHQSIRNLKESTTPNVELDLRSLTLKVPSAFGVRQHFVVDWDAISESTSGPLPHETLQVKHTAIVLASLRSLVLCTMLLTCPDSQPLLNLVRQCNDVVYMD